MNDEFSQRRLKEEKMLYTNKQGMIIIVALFVYIFAPAGFAREAGPLEQGEDGGYQLEMRESEGAGQEIFNDHLSLMSDKEKRYIRKKYEQFRKLPLEKQAFLKKQWRAFKALSLEDQEIIRGRYERFENMSKEKREELLRRYERWQMLSREEREAQRRAKQTDRKQDPQKR